MLNPEDLYLANTKILDDPRMHGLTLVIALSSPQDAGPPPASSDRCSSAS